MVTGCHVRGISLFPRGPVLPSRIGCQALDSHPEEHPRVRIPDSVQHCYHGQHASGNTSCLIVASSCPFFPVSLLLFSLSSRFFTRAHAFEGTKRWKKMCSRLPFRCLSPLFSRPLQGMFSPYVKSFFVSGRDPFYLRKLKLEVMTLVANDSNVHPILKEFQVRERR